ncbi:MAG: dihydroorotase, partial [Clostridia bacterium]|nr:dihydroorotase [Clostridia bacterium]
MKYLLQNGKAYLGKELTATGILIDGDRIVSISPEIPLSEDIKIIDCDGYVILPGLLDVHVHLREPGFSYKETIG